MASGTKSKTFCGINMQNIIKSVTDASNNSTYTATTDCYVRIKIENYSETQKGATVTINGIDAYSFAGVDTAITFMMPLAKGQKITFLTSTSPVIKYTVFSIL